MNYNSLMFGQEDLGHDYEHAKARMACHPERAKRDKRTIAKLHPFKSEKEAIEAAVALVKVNRLSSAIVWATIGKDEEYYYITDPWYVVDGADNKAAEYIGLYPVYDSFMFTSIVDGETTIDEFINPHRE